MADIAELGFQIDSSQAATAADNLDKMANSADRAASGTSRIINAIQKVTDQIGAMTSVIGNSSDGFDRMVDAQLKTI